MKRSVITLICIVCTICAIFTATPAAHAADLVANIAIVEELLQNGYAETTVASLEEAKVICHDIQAYIDAVSSLSETQKVSAYIAANTNTLKVTLKNPLTEGFSEEELTSLYTEAGSTVESINNFIVKMLSYDNKAAKNAAGLTLSSTQATAKGSLSTGKAICQGYSNLFTLIAEHAGIQNVKIRGYVRGIYHVMNVVRTEDGTLMAVDVTFNDSSGRNWSLIDFSDYCAKGKFAPEVDAETAFALKYAD